MNEQPGESLRVETCDGKYTVVLPDNGGLKALRYGAPWRDLVGDGLILSLAFELDEARKRIAELEQTVEGYDGRWVEESYMKYRPMAEAEVMLRCFRGLILNRTQAAIDSPCHRKLEAILRRMKKGRK